MISVKAPWSLNLHGEMGPPAAEACGAQSDAGTGTDPDVATVGIMYTGIFVVETLAQLPPFTSVKVLPSALMLKH